MAKKHWFLTLTLIFLLSTIHHLIIPSDGALERGRGAKQGKTSPTEQQGPNHTGKHISHRGETLSPRLPEALLLLPWPAASSQVQSFSPFLVASLATFKFHPWGQGQMSAWVLTKAFLCGAIICSEDFRANGTGLS